MQYLKINIIESIKQLLTFWKKNAFVLKIIKYDYFPNRIISTSDCEYVISNKQNISVDGKMNSNFNVAHNETFFLSLSLAEGAQEYFYNNFIRLKILEYNIQIQKKKKSLSTSKAIKIFTVKS